MRVSYSLNHLLAWSIATKDEKKMEKQQDKTIKALAKFVIAEWGLLIDHEILTIKNGNSEEGTNDAVDNGNDEDSGNAEDSGNNEST